MLGLFGNVKPKYNSIYIILAGYNKIPPRDMIPPYKRTKFHNPSISESCSNQLSYFPVIVTNSLNQIKQNRSLSFVEHFLKTFQEIGYFSINYENSIFLNLEETLTNEIATLGFQIFNMQSEIVPIKATAPTNLQRLFPQILSLPLPPREVIAEHMDKASKSFQLAQKNREYVQKHRDVKC